MIDDRVSKAKRFILDVGAKLTPHSGSSLFEHLNATYLILQSWGMDDDICLAGLYHSVYGTLTYPQELLSLKSRVQVRDIIGELAERYVFLFATTTRASLFANLRSGSPCRLLDGRTWKDVLIDERTLRALLHIATANWIEQHSRVAAGTTGIEFFALRQWLVPAARAAVEQECCFDENSLFKDDSDLLSLLSWKDILQTGKSVVGLENAYLSLLASVLYDRLPTAEWEKLSSIANGGFGRILRAPETSRFVWGANTNSDSQALINYINSAVHLELWRNGTPITLNRGTWSASADVYLPIGYHEKFDYEEREFDKAAPFFTEQLEGGILIDLDSPSSVRPFVQNSFRRNTYGPPEAILPLERKEILQKLREAMVILRRGSPAAYRFVLGNLHTVIPRKQTKLYLYPFGFNGSSTAACMGRAALNNSHYTSISAGQVAQSLLHESIHIYLYKREFFNPTVRNWEQADALRIESLWSGNIINHYAFAHAALVFFGIANFFAEPTVVELAGAEVANNYVDRALTGFESSKMDQALESIEKTVSPEIGDVLRRVNTEVKKRFPEGPKHRVELRAPDDLEVNGWR